MSSSTPQKEDDPTKQSSASSPASTTSTNRAFFDNLASKYENRPFVQEISAKIAEVFLSLYEFDDEKTRVLDFACGTGLISRHLAPHSSQIIGVDISQEMVDEFNQRVEYQGIRAEEMRAVCSDLLKDAEVDAAGKECVKDEIVEELGGKFDVVVCSMSYHHLPSLPVATHVLSSLLISGGKLLVADLYKDDNSISGSTSSSSPSTTNEHNHLTHSHCSHTHHDHYHNTLVPHSHGLTISSIRNAFESAGLGDIDVRKRIRVRGSKKGAGKGNEMEEKEEKCILIASGVKA